MSKTALHALHVKTCQKLACLFLLFYLPLALQAKTPFLTVSGLVTDSKNNPLYGVSVVVKGTAKGTTTGTDGRFSIPDVPDDGVLVFSYTGFGQQEIAVRG